jgi:hypothetical protein
MAHFLRDQLVKNLSITSDKLIQISQVVVDRAKTINDKIVPGENSDLKEALLYYVIRFDNKGYRVFSIEELLRYFHHASEVERVVFTVETVESFRSSRSVGAYLELRLDEKDPSACILVATSDDKDWVDASFSAVQDALAKCKNRHGWVRTAWTPFGVQIIGVILGFILSLWIAAKMTPYLAIENAFVFSFLFSLLVFSNTWMFLSQQVIRLMNIAFPNIHFFRPDKERMHWLFQAIIGGIVAAAVLYALSQVFAFFSEFLSGIVSKGH